MTPRRPLLVLWDIDRTLLYAGTTDRLVYTEVFTELVGRPPERLPAKGTGRTVPLAVEELLRTNGVPEHRLPDLAAEAVRLVPLRQQELRDHMRTHGEVLPGAEEALKAVAALPSVVATVVTGNLQASAELKLDVFGLGEHLDTSIGGYSSDDPHRPNLVAIARNRARARHGADFTPESTVIIGDSLEDVTTGREGGAAVVGVASGTTPAAELAASGAYRVVHDLTDPEVLCAALEELRPRERS